MASTQEMSTVWSVFPYSLRGVHINRNDKIGAPISFNCVSGLGVRRVNGEFLETRHSHFLQTVDLVDVPVFRVDDRKMLDRRMR
jgi:hypothetical protein